MRLLSPAGLKAAALYGLFSLAVAASAQAQTLTLNSGDNAIVSSTGTIGFIGGKPINNNISDYSIFGSGGTVVQTSGTAAFTFAGGRLFSPDGNTDIYVGGSGPVTISGGTIGASHGSTGLDAAGTGLVRVSGGTFSADQTTSINIGVSSGAAVQITGGNFSSAPLAVASGGTLYLFSKNDSPFTVTGIPGQPFGGTVYNNTSLNLASIPSNFFSTYGLAGTLADGESFNVNLMGLGIVDFNLPAPAAVPEASTTVSLGLLLLLGLGGMVLAKRRAKTAASSAA